MWLLALVGLAGVFVFLAAYDLSSMPGALGVAGATATTGTASPQASPPAGAKPAALPRPPAASPSSALRPLTVTSVAAFGPEGFSDGDNPALAPLALGDSTARPWSSLWYATPQFSNLQQGTGLLLDMGGRVTVAAVRLVLGSAAGADVQVRVGDVASPQDLPTSATASGIGGKVRLAVQPGAQGRYVLIWFTRLPPDGFGHFMVSVYSIIVTGTG